MIDTSKPYNYLGTFTGFNLRDDCAVPQLLTANEVIEWDHEADGDTDFAPSGDNAGMLMVFKKQVTSADLVNIDKLLTAIGDDSLYTFARIYYACEYEVEKLSNLTKAYIEDMNLHIFIGKFMFELRQEAAFELFELYYPEAFKGWDASRCDGLIFDIDKFLGSPSLQVEEINNIGELKVLIVNMQ
jgi:hypothetical protein